MSFLVLENDVVRVTDEGMNLTCVKELYSRDRHSGKPWFNACITYAYYMHKKGGVFNNMLPTNKATRICSEILKEAYKYEAFESDYYYKNMEREYINLQYSRNEQLYERIGKDIEGLMQRISEIPYTTTKIHECVVEFPGPDGTMIKHTAKVPIEIDNSEEKAKAIKLAETLIDFEIKLKSKIVQETKEKRKARSQDRLFEKEQL